MPKGKRGCFNCGAPTTRVIQVVDREILEWRSGATREKTVGSMQRNYCTACAEPVYQQLHKLLERWHDKPHGCGVCRHSPTDHRIQVWMRRLIGGPDGRKGYRNQISMNKSDHNKDASYDGARAVRKRNVDALQNLHRIEPS